MALYQVQDENTQVHAGSAKVILEGLAHYRYLREELIQEYGLHSYEGWHPMSKALSMFKKLEEMLGPEAIYSIGKSIPIKMGFNPAIHSLKEALTWIDELYHQFLKGGEAGAYLLDEYDEDRQRALIRSTTPYPTELEFGIIESVANHYRPYGQVVRVQLDCKKERKRFGGQSDSFIVEWYKPRLPFY